MNDPTRQSWYDMKRRCLNKSRPEYVNYGGRGITVCARWMVYKNFLEDMGPRPEGLFLERKNNNLGYYKDNCKWATRQEQNSNKGLYKNSTSGVTGVAKNRVVKRGKEYIYWTAWASIDGQTYRLYHGSDFNEAVAARKVWEQGEE